MKTTKIHNTKTGEYYYADSVFQCRDNKDRSVYNALMEVRGIGEKSISVGCIVAEWIDDSNAIRTLEE